MNDQQKCISTSSWIINEQNSLETLSNIGGTSPKLGGRRVIPTVLYGARALWRGYSMKWTEGNVEILFSALPLVVFNFDFCIFGHLINYAWVKSNQNKQNLKIASAHFIAASLEIWAENTCLKRSFLSSADIFGGDFEMDIFRKMQSKILVRKYIK